MNADSRAWENERGQVNQERERGIMQRVIMVKDGMVQ